VLVGMSSTKPKIKKQHSSSLFKAHERGSFTRLMFENEHCHGGGHPERSRSHRVIQFIVVLLRAITPACYIALLIMYMYPDAIAVASTAASAAAAPSAAVPGTGAADILRTLGVTPDALFCSFWATLLRRFLTVFCAVEVVFLWYFLCPPPVVVAPFSRHFAVRMNISSSTLTLTLMLTSCTPAATVGTTCTSSCE